MPKRTDQKLRLLYVREILRTQSDETHLLTVRQILEILRRQYGILAERKSILDDLRVLEEYGEALLRRPGRGGGVALVEREFQLSELKLLIDMVQSSNFITEKKSRELIKRLSGFCSASESSALKRHVSITDRPKSDNETIFYQLDALNRAITENRQVRFSYFDYNMEKRKVYRHDGKCYQVSPWELTVDDGKYYLVASETSSGSIRHYRVDKMERVTLLEARCLQDERLREDTLARYTKRVFGMFGGEALAVVLRCDASLAHILFDRFGMEEITPRPVGSDRHWFDCGVRVVPSPQFFGWIAGFGGRMQLIAPTDVREAYRRFLQTAMDAAIAPRSDQTVCDH